MLMDREAPKKRIHDVGECTLPQKIFLAKLISQRRVAFCGGIGAGKTYVGCLAIMNTPKNSMTMCISPTYSQLRDSTLRLFFELFETTGLIINHNKTNMETTLIGNRTILWRSGDNPSRLRGSSIGNLWIDEASYCDPELITVAMGRIRRQPGKCWLTMTPRGKNWHYRELIENNLFDMVHAPTRSNTFNPEFYLESLKAAYGDTAFAQQELEGLFVDTDGALMKSSWLKPWTDPVPEKLILARGWDCAATRDGGDYSASVLMGMLPGTSKVIILDVTRQRYAADAIDPEIKKIAERDGKLCTVVLEQEPGSAGKRLIQHQLGQLSGYRVSWYGGGNSMSKITRAVPFARSAAAGDVYYLPDKPWQKLFFEEMDDFTGTPADKHDDQVDALSIVHSHLLGKIRKVIAV